LAGSEAAKAAKAAVAKGVKALGAAEVTVAAEETAREA
jgi:hypothetical protein